MNAENKNLKIYTFKPLFYMYQCFNRIPKAKQTPIIIEKGPSSESLEDSRGLDNPNFVSDNGKTSSSNPTINKQSTYLAAPPAVPELARSPRDRKLHQLLLGSKMPLEKSFSMPDMQTKTKKRQRLMALVHHKQNPFPSDKTVFVSAIEIGCLVTWSHENWSKII